VSMTPVDRLVVQHPSKDYETMRDERAKAWGGDTQRLGLSSLGKRLVGLDEW
jgi:hypothetical protein